MPPLAQQMAINRQDGAFLKNARTYGGATHPRDFTRHSIATKLTKTPANEIYLARCTV